MQHRSLFLALLFLLTVGQIAAEQTTPRWPIDGTIDLSSGFGDYRENRFHAGLDLRTGGRTGKPVLAPVDGYVSRLKTSYTGYGRGLYFRGSDGFIYVFGHLSRYFPGLEKRMTDLQLAAKRYAVDATFPEDSIQVKKGELLAYSGETGAGAPHLHFEKRTTDNIPLNPLTHSFALTDKTPPTFTEIGFALTDDHSLMQNGGRETYLDAHGSEGAYRLDTVLYLNSPFGVLTNCYDMMNPKGMRQAVYKLSWFVDDSLYYETTFDTLRYDQSEAAKLEYDYFRAVAGDNRVRRLFQLYSNPYSGDESPRLGKGVFGLEHESPGRKHGLIVAEDAFGNKSKLSFDFIWGVPHTLFVLDSSNFTEPDTTRFYFSPRTDLTPFGIDSVQVLLNREGVWGKPRDVTTKPLVNGKILATAIAKMTSRAQLRLAVKLQSGTIVLDTIFNGVVPYATISAQATPVLVDGGMLVSVPTKRTLPGLCRFVLYNAAESLGVAYPKYLSERVQTAFIPASAKYQHITRIGLAPLDKTKAPTYWVDSLNIVAVGIQPKQEFALDDRCTIQVKAENFYAPQFIELKSNKLLLSGFSGIVSDHYEIEPEAIMTKAPFQIELKLIPGHPANPYVGLCWLDKKKNEWIWLGGKPVNDVVKGESSGGGSFAAVLDKEPPQITIYGVRDTMTISDHDPRISFRIKDDLSGIEDDQSIVVKVNGKWVPVEYDTEKEMATVMLPWSLPDGEQHLAINVTDRAGHLGERYMHFYIKSPSGKGK